MPTDLSCWRCGAAIDEALLPLVRQAACASCGVDLHVCRLCHFFDPGRSGGCREPIADWVQDKERANFCGYFQAAGGRYRAASLGAERAARAALASLFGDGVPETKPGQSAPEEWSQAERARAEWARLFGSDTENGGGHAVPGESTPREG